nr:hypothetical protein Q903MT_gene1993 [Picea sitchensis]
MPNEQVVRRSMQMQTLTSDLFHFKSIKKTLSMRETGGTLDL